ncbi:hypothetical protein ACYPKM_04815 [Pseudomonas aeruginosa]
MLIDALGLRKHCMAVFKKQYDTFNLPNNEGCEKLEAEINARMNTIRECADAFELVMVKNRSASAEVAISAALDKLYQMTLASLEAWRSIGDEKSHDFKIGQIRHASFTWCHETLYQIRFKLRSGTLSV